jgi:formylglycine-generating enzyme required for sulfatase activity
MSKIFLSYRRDDSADATGRLYDRLAAHYSGENIFRDVDTIPLGVDFRTHLHEAVGRCGVLLAIIGRQWLSVTHSAGQRRLDDPRDFVRIEIEAALQRNIPVIPVLVQGATMPVVEDLPPSLQLLAFRNGIAVRPDPDFHRDVDRLIQYLDRLFTATPPAAVPASPQRKLTPQPTPAAAPKQQAEQKARELAGEGRFAEAVQELLRLPPALRSLALLDDLREQWRTQVHDEANRLAAAYDYAAAAEALEKLPPELRDAELLAACQSRRDRLEQLREEIHADWQANRKSFLRLKVDELLKLKPDDDDMVRLYQKLPEASLELTNTSGVKMVLVPPGSFWMGGSQQVQIPKPFYVGVYPVTQGQWQAVMGNNPSYFSRTGGGKDKVKKISDADLAQFPVEQVSWDDVQEFLKKLNAKEKSSEWVYRLPTEAEWEYICRGRRTSFENQSLTQDECSFQFYFDQPTNTLTPQLANFNNTLGRTSKVGSYQANRLGIHDLHGNVCEWCDDLWDGGPRRVVRGGSGNIDAGYCAAASRLNSVPGNRYYYLGFRLARVLSQGK